VCLFDGIDWEILNDFFIFEGCCETAALEVTLDTGSVYIPNLITPNDDGVNDYLSLFCSPGIEIINSFIVKNTENQLIFSNTDLPPYAILSSSWDAKDTDGNPLHGVFNVEVIVTSVLGSSKTLNLKVCSHPCDGTGSLIENGTTNCNVGGQHDGLGGLDVNRPKNESGCF